MASGSYRNCLYASTVAGTSKNTFTTELCLNAGSDAMKSQAKITPDFWGPSPSDAIGRGFHIIARGIISTTGTPTFTWTVRGLGTTSTPNITTAPVLLGGTAITTLSAVSSAIWEIEGDVVLEALGTGPLSTIRGLGRVSSAGFSAAGTGNMFGGGATPGTTATFDTTVTNFINVNVACGTSSASNICQLLQLIVEAIN
jgi:hypothetical protein